ncbi:MAG: membrane protein insertase YidC [Cyclobacteriaceae bacterium]
MDKNQVIGLVLISLLLIGYMYLFNDEPQDQQTPAGTTEQVTETTPTPIEAAPVTPEVQSDPQIPDSVKEKQLQEAYGSFASALSGSAQEIVVENEDMIITFSTKGGVPVQAELKSYKTFDQKPLILFDQSTNAISLRLPTVNKPVDLSELHFQTTATNQTIAPTDTFEVVFELPLENGQSVIQKYRIAGQGFQVAYDLDLSQADGLVTDAPLSFHWRNHLKKFEQELKDSRNNASINYYLSDGTFEDLGDNSLEGLQETITQPMKWVTMKQKFFVSGVIAAGSFNQGTFTQEVVESDTVVLKTDSIALSMNMAEVKDQPHDMTYYFGPNKYQVLKKVAPDFSRNVYLGWAIFGWINKYFIIPIFSFLEKYVANYGVIIIILAFFIKIILSPISYKSYHSMAKMKVLKPELDAIKAKHEGDMQKAQADQMALYRKAGVNPLSGCIPMLLQMPILFAMFNFFPNSIELRQEGFLWAHDLSTYDSILSLPFEVPFYGDHVSLFTLLMAGSTLLYTLANAQMTTVQGPMKTMQYFMPIMMIFIFNSFASALTFYYFILNMVNWGQQMVIKKYFIDDEKIKRIMEENKLKNKHKKKSKFAARIEEAMRAAEQQKTQQVKKKKKTKK